jgi:hypothetical protein
MSRSWLRAWTATLGALVALAAGGFAQAEGPGLDVAAGIGGIRRTGAWTPLVVTAAEETVQAGETLHAWVEDPDGQFVRSPPAVATATGDGRVAARFSVRFGRPSGRVRIERAGRIAEHVLGEPIASTEGVAVVLGDLPAVARAARLIDRDHGTKTRVLPVAVTGDGPRGFVAGGSGRDYDAADTIVVSGSAAMALPADVLAGIDAWVEGGGRLVLVAGASALDIAAAAGVAARWLPGRIERLVPLRRVGAIESYARAAGLADRLPAAGLAMPRFAGPVEGVIELAAGEDAAAQPLVVRRARGFGTVTWLGVDADSAVLTDWRGWDGVFVALLGGRALAASDSARTASAAVPDLAGQLRAALDTFPTAGAGAGPRPVPFEVIAGLGLLYVFCLYPLDWWLVSRDGGRPWLSWLTLPALVAAFTGLAWGTATWWSGGRAAVSRVAGVVDIDASRGMVRGSAWAAVLAPDNDLVDVAVAARSGEDAVTVGGAHGAGEAAVSWFAAAGRGFGGLDAGVAHPSLAAADYGYASRLDRLERVPIAASSSRQFEAEWSAAARSNVATSTLFRNEQGTLGGTITHDLPFPLGECRLLHAGWLYDLGTIVPGQTVDITAGRGPRSLASAITRRAAMKERDLAVRWDAASTDVARILEVAGFHAAAGGAGYTGLQPGRLGRLDLSPLLTVDRAVLVGRVPDGREASAWRFALADGRTLADASPAAPTLCRIVIPLVAEPAP